MLSLTIGVVLGILIGTVSYYLCKYIYEILYDKEIEKAPLGLVVKVNAIVLFKTLLGLIFFIIPGIVIGLKYAPVNYVLCKHPDISFILTTLFTVFSMLFSMKLFSCVDEIKNANIDYL